MSHTSIFWQAMEIPRYGCPHPAWNDVGGGLRASVPPRETNDTSVGVHRLLHTGLAVEVTIGAVGADGVLPDDAG